jgi:hypothetical protein
VIDFLWLDWNRQKIDDHALSTDEVEFAWENRVDFAHGEHPENGPYTESFGRCPSGRVIKIVWRYDVDRNGEQVVFVITAHGRNK